MKVLRNWFQTLRNCRGALFPPLLQVHWKSYVKNWFSNRNDAGWDKNIFPGPIHQIYTSFNLAVTKILYFLFSVSCRVCHVLPGYLLPQPGHLHQVVPPPKKNRKINKFTMRAVHRWKCAVFVSGWEISGQNWAIWTFLLSHLNIQC